MIIILNNLSFLNLNKVINSNIKKLLKLRKSSGFTGLIWSRDHPCSYPCEFFMSYKSLHTLHQPTTVVWMRSKINFAKRKIILCNIAVVTVHLEMRYSTNTIDTTQYSRYLVVKNASDRHSRSISELCRKGPRKCNWLLWIFFESSNKKFRSE